MGVRDERICAPSQRTQPATQSAVRPGARKEMPSLEDGARAAQQDAASTGSASDRTVLLDTPPRWRVPQASMDLGASCDRTRLTTTRAKALSLGNVPKAPEGARLARLTYMVSTPSGDNWSYGYDTLDRLLTATNSADTSTRRTCRTMPPARSRQIRPSAAIAIRRSAPARCGRTRRPRSLVRRGATTRPAI